MVNRLEIIYRIYEVCEKSEQPKTDNGFFTSYSKKHNNEIEMDCIICDTREQFKDIIRDRFGKEIKFSYSKKLPIGSFYCVIIGEHCFNTERYFNKVEFICDCCGKKVIDYIGNHFNIDNYTIKYDFFNIAEYGNKRFCSTFCRDKYITEEKAKIKPNNEQEFYVSRDMFTEKVSGYIYKITKKSTNEFYVGQTIYAPIFRWGQHLKTERFDINNIIDYKFETIEIVPKEENILEREKYWIQKCYKENPTKSLNIMQTTNLNQISISEIIKESI